MVLSLRADVEDVTEAINPSWASALAALGLGMEFEWDEDKRRRNLNRHGVDFARAVLVFDDPAHFVVPDLRKSYGETRFRAVGRIGERLFRVVFTMRGEVRRIITAWSRGRNVQARYQAILDGRAPGDE